MLTSHDDRFFANGYRASLSVLLLGFQLTFVYNAIRTDNNALRLFGIAVVVLYSFGWWRLSQGPSVRLTDDSIVIVGLYRTTRLAWTDVVAIEPTRIEEVLPLRWRAPMFHLVDGSMKVAVSMRAVKDPSVVDELVAEVQRRLLARSVCRPR